MPRAFRRPSRRQPPARVAHGFARRLAWCVTILLATAATDALAWGPRGHAMVGDIASALLRPEATLEVDQLLRDDLGADGRPSGRSTLGQVASWPDELRATPGGRSTDRYHFDDIPVCGPMAALDAIPADPPWCPDGRCATAWFRRQVAILADPAQPVRARNEALKWIVHLVGDLHQPLHASDHDDRGGNDVRIAFYGRRADDPVDGRPASPYSLHTAWDRLIPARVLDAHGDDAFRAALPDEATRRRWEAGDVDAWTLESHEIARDFVYPALPAFRCGAPVTTVEALDDAYVVPASDLVATQLRRAGVRLAKVLNDTLVAR